MALDDDPEDAYNASRRSPEAEDGGDEAAAQTADLHRQKSSSRRRRSLEEAFDFDPALLGDPSADERARDAEWRRVFEHFDPRLRDFFAYQRPDSDELDDLLLHVWRAALRGFGSLQSPRAAWSYLLAVGKNYLRDQWAAEARQDRNLDLYGRYIALEEELQQEMPNVLDRLAHEDGWAEGRWPVDPEEFAQRMSQLSDAERELILLRHVRDMTHEQVAEEFGISPSATRKRYSRILKHLRGDG
jgi:RNA polymerase sigma factor (sigma-70 family)